MPETSTKKSLSRIIFILLLMFLVNHNTIGQSLSSCASNQITRSKNGFGYMPEAIGEDTHSIYFASFSGYGLSYLNIVAFDKKTMGLTMDTTIKTTKQTRVIHVIAINKKIYIFRNEINSGNWDLTCETFETKPHSIATKKTLITNPVSDQKIPTSISYCEGENPLISVSQIHVSREDYSVLMRCVFYDLDLNETQNRRIPIPKTPPINQENYTFLSHQTRLSQDRVMYFNLYLANYGHPIGPIGEQFSSTAYLYNYQKREMIEISSIAQEEGLYYCGIFPRNGATILAYHDAVEKEGDFKGYTIGKIFIKPSNIKLGLDELIEIAPPAEFMGALASVVNDGKDQVFGDKKTLKLVPYNKIRVHEIIPDSMGYTIVFEGISIISKFKAWGDVCVVKINFKGEILMTAKLEKMADPYEHDWFRIKILVIEGKNELFLTSAKILDYDSEGTPFTIMNEPNNNIKYARINLTNGLIAYEKLKVKSSYPDIQADPYRKIQQMSTLNNQFIISTLTEQGEPKKRGHLIRVFPNQQK